MYVLTRRVGDWKLIAGDPGGFNGWYPAPEDPEAVAQTCPPAARRQKRPHHQRVRDAATDLKHEPSLAKLIAHRSLDSLHSKESLVHEMQMAIEDELLDPDGRVSPLATASASASASACRLNHNEALYEPSLVDFERHAHAHSLVEYLHLEAGRPSDLYRDGDFYLFNLKGSQQMR